MVTVLRIRVNGRDRELTAPEAGASVLDLLAIVDQNPATVAVELNRSIVPRADFGDTPLADGDRVEIVRFVQGGAPNSGMIASCCRPPLAAVSSGAGQGSARRLGR